MADDDPNPDTTPCRCASCQPRTREEAEEHLAEQNRERRLEQ